MNEQANNHAHQISALSELTDMVVDQISKLGALRDAGLLTEEEFTTKKSELLSRI